MNISTKLLWQIFKPEIFKSYLKQKEIRYLPITEIKKIQWNKLKELLEFVYISSEFYNESFKSINLQPKDIKSYKDLQKLPVINKLIIKENYNKILSKGSTEKDFILSYTAGSTGEPFPFLLDKKREAPLTFAAFMLNKESMGIDPFKKYNELMIKAKPTNEIKNLLQSDEKRILQKFKYFLTSETFGINSANINKDNTNYIYTLIKNKKIEVIYGYASNVYNLAKFFKTTSTKVKIKYIILIAEGLLKQQKDLISDTFNCPVYMDYGASECMRMGFECNNTNGYHMDIFNYYFEYLNDNGEPCRPGEKANIIVTNLNNYVFPLIRYNIGDQCILSNEKCSCGVNYPIIDKIIGRDSEFIITPLNDEIALNDFQVCLHSLYEYINQYQFIVDKKNNKITIKIVPTERFGLQISKQIKESILKLIKYSMKIDIKLVEYIPMGGHGKTKLLLEK